MRTDEMLLAHMAAGGLYSDNDPQLNEIRHRTGVKMERYNALLKAGKPDEARAVLEDTFAAIGPHSTVGEDVDSDIGEQTFVGDHTHIGNEAVLYACAPLHIGNHVHIGPQVQFLTADHGLIGHERARGDTRAYGITVKDHAIIEAKAQILSGITIGKGAIVRACSIVTKDVPDYAVVSGAPARIIEEEELKDVKLATEYDQILKDMAEGRPYNDFDPQLSERRRFAAAQIKKYTESDNDAEKKAALDALMASCGEGVHIVPPFSMEFGMFVSVGDNTFINRGSIFLDCAPVKIGSHVMMGPNVCFFTSNHALTVPERNAGVITAKPVTVGDNVWIGGNTTILGGVTIGEGSVIGAGSVVTRDIPAGVVAVGNPCRVLRPITEADSLMDKD